ncbi:shikimate kinase AroL [Desulfovibrio legallii]|uniref:Shikimate kinase n=1 Tax=Desulfovibrio legallii TaxID=571438 RepID=A0A1G7KVP2_9BACT|nr:shikimate kinase AroL [Desulfovibrio legallii]SDF41328.1 shikimate kinase [Desulfovibrio legallii]
MQENATSPSLVFLVGARASGKTTVGRVLARRLGLPFVDTDAAVAASTGKTVAEIVAAEGWPGFRRRESAALRAAAAAHPGGVVVATGGGMVLAAENRAYMRAQGVVLYLEAPAALLAARLACDPQAAQRPSLTGLDAAQEAARVLAERAPLYAAAAHHRLDAALPPEQICAAVADLIALAAERRAGCPPAPSARRAADPA